MYQDGITVTFMLLNVVNQGLKTISHAGTASFDHRTYAGSNDAGKPNIRGDNRHSPLLSQEKRAGRRNLVRASDRELHSLYLQGSGIKAETGTHTAGSSQILDNILLPVRPHSHGLPPRRKPQQPDKQKNSLHHGLSSRDFPDLPWSTLSLRCSSWSSDRNSHRKASGLPETI